MFKHKGFPSMAITQIEIDGLPAFRLQSPHLLVDVAPGVGGRLVRLVHRPTGQDFFWHNQALALERLEPDADYNPNFYGGMDELLPNDIREPLNGHRGLDHGELWTTALESEIAGEALVLRGLLPLCGLRYERTLSLAPDGAAMTAHYRITNGADAPRAFMLKLHPAFAIDPGDRIECPAARATVAAAQWSRWGDAPPFAWPHAPRGGRADLVPENDGTTDFLVLDGLRSGTVALHRRRLGLTVRMDFDTGEMPFVWLFASYGGFYGHTVAVIEPCNTMPNRVDEARGSGRTTVLAPGEYFRTQVTFSVEASGPENGSSVP